MFIPVRTDTPLRRTPYMNYALIVANVIVFMCQQGVIRGSLENMLLLQPRDPRLWQFFTYQFLHGSILHIVGNMLFLYIFGNNVNDKLGNFGYLGFYLAGGVFAGIAHVLTSSEPVLGASGAIAAVTGAYLVLLPYSRITIFYFFYLIGTFELSGLWFVLLFFAMDIFEQFSSGMFGGREAVAHMAHIGGTFFGFAVCMTLLSVRLLPRDMWDLFGILDRWNRRRQHRDAVSKGYDPFGYTPRQTPNARPDPMMERIQDTRASISEAVAQQRLPDAVKLYLELRAIDPNQVMSRQTQLDIANQLFADGLHPAAADAYELFLRTYPKAEQIENVQLILAIVYARYLNRYDRAKELLTSALTKLHAERDIELAKSELARIEPLLSKPV
ncbi:MAG TPA: rhomboid family intramembrane serine protease [Tepidisphaeraceae bacterium]|jgi:membrane associated rhomboid family serine protease|nr:rhomboid family intramembrane serine protease [Tepidisphaeraceae bacterium]